MAAAGGRPERATGRARSLGVRVGVGAGERWRERVGGGPGRQGLLAVVEMSSRSPS